MKKAIGITLLASIATMALSACGGQSADSNPPGASVDPPSLASSPDTSPSTGSGWSGLPITRQITSSDGWSYEVTVSRLPDMTVSTDISSSPPGSAKLTIATSGGVTIEAESLDVGRTAPEPGLAVDVVGWNPSVAPKGLDSDQYRTFAPLQGDVMDGAMACMKPLRTSFRIECSTGDWALSVNPSGDSDQEVLTNDMPEGLADELAATVLVPDNLYAGIVVSDPNGQCAARLFISASGEATDGDCDDKYAGLPES